MARYVLEGFYVPGTPGSGRGFEGIIVISQDGLLSGTLDELGPDASLQRQYDTQGFVHHGLDELALCFTGKTPQGNTYFCRATKPLASGIVGMYALSCMCLLSGPTPLTIEEAISARWLSKNPLFSDLIELKETT